VRAAVLRRIGDQSLDVVEDVRLAQTGPGLVRVAVRATGVCHSDLSAMSGAFGIPTPCVMGHEVAARLAGAAEIVGVDVVATQREQALRFGATRAIAPEEVEEAKSSITGSAGGFDYAFEAVGQPSTIRAAYDAVRRGGTAVIIGVGHREQSMTFDAYELAYGDKTIRGTWFGSADPRVEFPRVLHLWKTGRLDLEGMITHRGTLLDIDIAFANMKAGAVIRTVLSV
jgi:S-(hydroxymethyl)glutathione dehydrogenase / alcohol dehydrogenase